jgi:hypothetical protein
MNILIGSIKHCNLERVYAWAKSASIYVSARKILLCLDETIPEDLKQVEDLGFELIHIPTQVEQDINISKFERHFASRKFLESVEDNACVLLTDTLDIVFQKDPFEWYERHKTNKILLTSEGVTFAHEHWNMRGVINAFKPFVDEIRSNDVLNSGIIMGEVKYIRDLLMYIYALTLNVKPEHTEGIDQPAMNVAMLSNALRDLVQITTTSEGFAVNCAVAGPTEQFIPWGFSNSYKYDLPSFNGELVVNKNNEPYCLVHQYNRVHEWNNFFRTKYKYKPYVQSIENTAIVLCTKTTSSFHNDWKKAFRLGNNDYMLCNTQPGHLINPNVLLDYVQDNIINYSTDNLREALNFYAEPSDMHRWNLGGGRNIVWFYPHFRMMYFYKLFPEYEYYWFFDDDVTFPQNELYDFVNAHKDLDHDCMITYLFCDLNAENPSKVLEMEHTMGSYHSHDHNWLTHYPGPGDIQPPDIVDKYGSYFPLVRMSNKALKTLVEEHDRGYYGYSEGYVPTILNYRGLKLYSIYNKQNKVAADEDITVYHRNYLDLVWKNV